MPEITVFPDKEAFYDAAVDLFINQAQESIEKQDRFTAALSGGGTPEPVYAALGAEQNRERVNWLKVHLFWGDERHVPPTDPDSNYRMVKEALLDKVPIPDENVHRVPAEMDVRLAAFSYEEELRGFFKGEWPRFNLVLLGMGVDGHTASLFPHSAGLNEENRWFIANYAPERETWRLTLTKNAINAAKLVVVLVHGDSKAQMINDVLTGPNLPQEKPIQLISPEDGKLVWLLDSEAASLLPSKLIS